MQQIAKQMHYLCIILGGAVCVKFIFINQIMEVKSQPLICANKTGKSSKQRAKELSPW